MIQFLKISILMVLLLPALSITSLYAQEQRLELEGTSIIGNKELPRVLYIVPWQAPEKIDIATPPVSSILDQPLSPIDRGTFRRQLIYHKALFPDAGDKP